MKDDPFSEAPNPAAVSRGPWTALALAVFSLLVPVLCFHLWLVRRFPSVASEQARGIDHMLNYLLVSVGVLLVIGHVALAWFVWKYSRQGQVTFRLAWTRTEWKLALVPVILMALVAEGGVLVIGVPVWNKFYAAAPPSEAVLVEVTAEQFAWTMRYPGADGKFGRLDSKLISEENPLGRDLQDPAGQDDVVVGGQLALPVNRPAHLKLRTKDVIHSLFLPNQRVKQDVVPGMIIDAWFVPTATGTFEILCTELCGLGHYKMRGVLTVTASAEFDQWLAERAAGGSSYE